MHNNLSEINTFMNSHTQGDFNHQCIRICLIANLSFLINFNQFFVSKCNSQHWTLARDFNEFTPGGHIKLINAGENVK